MKNNTTREQSLAIAQTIFPLGENVERLISDAEKIESYLSRTYFVGSEKPALIPNTDASRYAYSFEDFLRECFKINKEHQDFDPYVVQKTMANSLQKRQRLLILSSRQMGLSTIISAYALWKALFKRDQTILILSPKYAQALENIDRIVFAYNCLPDSLKHSQVNFNKGGLEFGNGSHILTRGASLDATRGLSVTALLVDQPAYISHAHSDECLVSWTQSLKSDDQIVLYGNAGVPKGLFYKLWTTGRDYDRLLFPWFLHPERNDESMDKISKMMTASQFRREWCCEFSND